jgi:hypothetical protein
MACMEDMKNAYNISDGQVERKETILNIYAGW